MSQPLRLVALASILTVALAALPESTALAGQPVDTSTLNPPPPDFVTCSETGSGTICRGSTSLDSTGIIPASENPCGLDITAQTTGTLDAALWYDQNGTLTRELDRNPGLLMSFSANGRTLTARDVAFAHIDLAGGMVKVTGMVAVLKIPGEQPVVNAGQTLIDLQTGEVSLQRGQHPGVLSPAVCAYLAGS